jgi:hypothetical protein
MSFSSVIDALGIPSSALVEQRVPKKLLLEHGAPTAADKRQIQNGIEEIVWVAALKPINIGVPAFDDGERQYLEIAVLAVELRPTAKPTRLIELIHRAIPYPVVLISGQGEAISLSLAHKRWSQGEAGVVVIEAVRQIKLNPSALSTHEAEFLASLAISRLPSRDLFTLYDGILARLAALEAARITGAFTPLDSPERATAVREALDRHALLQREIDLLRAGAAKENQMNHRVELNLEIKALESRLAGTTIYLKNGTSNESD